MALDFKNDNAMLFREPIKLINTKLCHYAIPITPYNALHKNINKGITTHVTLITTENSKSKYNIALKLHPQFAHPTPKITVKFLNSADEE